MMCILREAGVPDTFDNVKYNMASYEQHEQHSFNQGCLWHAYTHCNYKEMIRSHEI